MSETSKTIEGLKQEYTQIRGKAQIRADQLDQIRGRLAQLPALLATAEGKDHDQLAAEFGELQARAQVTAAEVCWIRQQQSAAYVAIFQAQEAAAVAELVTYEAEIYRPAQKAEQQAALAFRIASNRQEGFHGTPAEREKAGAQMIALGLAKEAAAAKLKYTILPGLLALRAARELATKQRQEAEQDTRQLDGEG